MMAGGWYMLAVTMGNTGSVARPLNKAQKPIGYETGSVVT